MCVGEGVERSMCVCRGGCGEEHVCVCRGRCGEEHVCVGGRVWRGGVELVLWKIKTIFKQLLHNTSSCTPLSNTMAAVPGMQQATVHTLFETN